MGLRRVILLVALLTVHLVVVAALQFMLVLLVIQPSELGDNVLGVLAQPWRIVDAMSEWVTLAYVVIPAVVVVVTQALFLIPAARPLMRGSGPPSSLWWSVVTAAFWAALLTVGLGFALVDLGIALSVLYQNAWADDLGPIWLPVIVVPLAWPTWIVLLHRFTRRHPGPGALDRLAGAILAGTVLETIVVLPLDLMHSRRDDCYCATGTFHTLVLAGTALIWLSGPGLLLAVTARRRRAWAARRCVHCGYPRAAGAGDRCPECGNPWGPVPPAPQPAPEPEPTSGAEPGAGHGGA